VPAESSWRISAPGTLDFDTAIEELNVRIVGGTINVVGTAEPDTRVEVSEVHGPPLVITRKDTALSVAYEDLPWQGFLKWFDRKGRDRRVVVTVSVPSRVRLSVGVVSASAVVSGIAGRTDVRGVNGDTTLVGLSGPVRADTVSGAVEVQALTSSLRFNSVSGGLTLIEGGGTAVKADSVSGDMILDLDPEGAGGEADFNLATVSGEIAIRLAQPLGARVEASTASGVVSSAFDELRAEGQWGAKKVTGTLGDGSGRLRATTASGSIALLRRPAVPAGEATPLSKDV
jgi:hypothetical protein